MAELEQLKKKFKSARDSMIKNQVLQQRDLDFYHGNQIDHAVKDKLWKKGQPATILNFINTSVDGMLGVIGSSQTEPRVYPRQPGSDNASDVATKVLRYISDKTDFQDEKLLNAFDMIVWGHTAGMIEIEQKVNFKKKTRDICIEFTRIRAEEFFYDPHSRDTDFCDAQYLGIAKWMDYDTVQAMYPNEDLPTWDSMSTAQGIFNDRPIQAAWIDSDRKRILLIEMYYKTRGEYGEESWSHAIFTGTNLLVDEVSKYEDDYGYKICPIVGTSCRVDSDNNRYGLVRGMIHSQMIFNNSASKLVNLINTRQAQKVDPQSPPVAAEIIRKELSRPDGIIPPGYNVVPTSDMASGQQLLMQEAQSYLNRLSPTPAVLGRVDQAISGRAKLVDQQAGLTEYAVTLSRLAQFEKSVYNRFWWAAMQYWNDHMIISITGDPESPDWLEINRPITQPVQVPITDPTTGQPFIDPMTGQPQMETHQQLVGYENDLATMEMDLTVEIVPEAPNLQTEVFEQVLNLVSKGIPLTSPEFEFALELAPIQDKQSLKNKLQSLKQEMSQAQQAQQQAQDQSQQLLSGKIQSETFKNTSKAQLDLATAQEKAAGANITNAANQMIGHFINNGNISPYNAQRF